MKRINIMLIEDLALDELKSSIFITGYTGFGLVGYLATRHIAFQLKMKRIGFVETKYMPESTFYTKHIGVIYPFEIYYKDVDGQKLLVLVNHSIPDARERTYYVRSITRWVRDINIKEAILVGGLDPAVRENKEEKYRWIPIGNANITLKAPILEERHVVGPLALTMMYLHAYKIPGVVILPYAEPYRPDPRATAIAVTEIAKLLDIEIDVSQLYKEAGIIEELESKKEELLKRVYETEVSEKGHPMYM